MIEFARDIEFYIGNTHIVLKVEIDDYGDFYYNGLNGRNNVLLNKQLGIYERCLNGEIRIVRIFRTFREMGRDSNYIYFEKNGKPHMWNMISTKPTYVLEFIYTSNCGKFLMVSSYSSNGYQTYITNINRTFKKAVNSFYPIIYKENRYKFFWESKWRNSTNFKIKVFSYNNKFYVYGYSQGKIYIRWNTKLYKFYPLHIRKSILYVLLCCYIINKKIKAMYGSICFNKTIRNYLIKRISI